MCFRYAVVVAPVVVLKVSICTQRRIVRPDELSTMVHGQKLRTYELVHKQRANWLIYANGNISSSRKSAVVD